MSYIQHLSSEYTFGPVLGKGGYGTVTQATHKKTNQVVAIKSIGLIESFVRELVMYSILNHPNVARLLGWSVDNTGGYLILPMGIDIWTAIQNKQITIPDTINGFLSGLSFLHNHGMFHGDIKDANLVLIDNRVTIIDFGASRFATPYNGSYIVKGIQATQGFVDPEYVTFDWNPIETELYAAAKTIRNLYTLSRNQPILNVGIVYDGLKSNDPQISSLMTELTRFPIVQRKPLRSFVPEAGTVRRLILKPIRCADEYTLCMTQILAQVGSRSTTTPYTARDVFLGCAIFRSVLIDILPNYEKNIPLAVEIGLTCIFLASVVIGDVEYKRSFQLDYIQRILQVSNGLLFPVSEWDSAQSYEDLLALMPKLQTCIETPPIISRPGQTKHVFFYKVYEASVINQSPLNDLDITVRGMDISKLSYHIDYYAKILESTYNLNSEYEMACFFMLHYRTLLGQLPLILAKTIFHRMKRSAFAKEVLQLIVDYPVDSMDFDPIYAHPFQVSRIEVENIKKGLI